jgi:hypothetical protein
VCGACLGLAGIAVAAPYWLTIGRLSAKPSVNEVLSTQARTWEGSPYLLANIGPVFASRFTSGVDGFEWADVSLWFALIEVLDEICKGFHFVLWVPALWSVFWFRRRIFAQPHLALLFLLALLHFLLVWRLAVVNRYVSERHTLMIVLCGCLAGLAAVFEGVAWLASRPPAQLDTAPRRPWWHNLQPQKMLIFSLLFLAAWGTLRTLRPLHPHRAGHKEAGLWLAAHAQPGDRLIDPYGWATFYAGRTPGLAKTPAAKRSRNKTCYIVVEPKDRDTTRLQVIRNASAETGLGEPVFAWPRGRTPETVLYMGTVKLPKAPRVSRSARDHPTF